MKKFMFDSNIFNKIADNMTFDIDMINHSQNYGYEYYITSIQVEELCAIRSKEKRIILMLSLVEIRAKLIPIKTYVHGFSRLGLAKLGDGYYFNLLLNESKSNSKDALIAESAIIKNCTLVTEDKWLIKKMISLGKEIITYDEFTSFLKEKTEYVEVNDFVKRFS